MATTTLLKRFLHSIPLGRKADPDLKAAVSAGDPGAFQNAFLAVLTKPVKRIRKRFGNRSLLASWSIDAVDLSGRERELAASLEALSSQAGRQQTATRRQKHSGSRKSKRSKNSRKYDEVVTNWLVEVGAAPGPWETIAVAEILLREGRFLSPENFTQALAVLADAALRDSSGSLFDVTTSDAEDNAIRELIRQGESPWISSLLLRPLGGIQTLEKSATESLRKTMLECADKDGLVHGSLLSRIQDWLAPVTRCTIWSDMFNEPLWRNDSAERLALITERAASMMMPVPKHQVHGDDAPDRSKPSLTEILEYLIPLSGSSQEKWLTKLAKKCRKPANKVTQPKKPRKIKSESDADEVSTDDGISSKRKSKVELKKQKRNAGRRTFESIERPELSCQSDSSCVAILRSSSDADADTITLEWHSSAPQIMVAAAGVPVFSGNWSCSVQLDDEVLPSPTAWKCSCWFLDPETVFIELEAEDASVVKLVRQVLLAPCDRFVIMTDSVTCKDPQRKVQLTTSLPLVPGVTCAACDVTRELTLSVGRRKIRTFPLWMEDDRIQHSLGTCREHDSKLELAGVGKGGVTLPLALDWHPSRGDVPADWTRCTVTESRRTVDAHEASGFRIRIGDHQVLVYRSLVTPAVSRAVLGLHTWDESVYGRVPLKGGLLQPLVEVEYPE